MELGKEDWLKVYLRFRPLGPLPHPSRCLEIHSLERVKQRGSLEQGTPSKVEDRSLVLKKRGRI